MKAIFINGRIYTLNSNQPVVEAVVVEDGKIIDLGTRRDMELQWDRAGTYKVDLLGNTVTPGLIDSHLHLSAVGLSLLDLDLREVSCKEDMLLRIKERAQAASPQQWVLGRGWDENRFTDPVVPTIEELDAAAPHCPIFLTRVCGHVFLANSMALEVSHYHPGMSVPAGGSVVLHPTTHQPTGLLLETASQLITKHIPQKTYDELQTALERAMKLALAQGLTSVHSEDLRYLGGLQQTYRLYDTLIHRKSIGLRSNLLIYYPYLRDLIECGMHAGYGDDKLQIGAVKIFADGALGGRTALLSEPYSDAPSTLGKAVQDEAALLELMRQARTFQMPVAIHAIGDQAVENVVSALRAVPPVRHRDRLIHAQVLRAELLTQLATPRLVVDIQPRFLASDFPWVAERLGPQRVQLAYAWKTLLSKGVLCAGGSDAPVEPVNPLLGIHAAVTRRIPGQSSRVWNDDERLTIPEAIQLFTIGGAYATGEERVKGTIERGKYADFTVYSKDLLSLRHDDELLEVGIEGTIVGGEVKYTKG